MKKGICIMLAAVLLCVSIAGCSAPSQRESITPSGQEGQSVPTNQSSLSSTQAPVTEAIQLMKLPLQEYLPNGVDSRTQAVWLDDTTFYLFAYDGDYHGNAFPASLFLVDSSTQQVTLLLHLEQTNLTDKLRRTEDGVRLFTREGCYFFSQDAPEECVWQPYFQEPFPQDRLLDISPQGWAVYERKNVGLQLVNLFNGQETLLYERSSTSTATCVSGDFSPNGRYLFVTESRFPPEEERPYAQNPSEYTTRYGKFYDMQKRAFLEEATFLMEETGSNCGWAPDSSFFYHCSDHISFEPVDQAYSSPVYIFYPGENERSGLYQAPDSLKQNSISPWRPLPGAQSVEEICVLRLQISGEDVVYWPYYPMKGEYGEQPITVLPKAYSKYGIIMGILDISPKGNCQLWTGHTSLDSGPDKVYISHLQL